MPRPPKQWSELFPPLRQYWQEINRQDRATRELLREQRKRRDRKRRRCTCAAYKFPHRPGGGLCRWPEPPVAHWRDAQQAEIADRVATFRAKWGEPSPEQMADLIALTTKPHRPYRGRYAGLLRQIARNNGLNPVRDRALIRALLPVVLAQAKAMKRQTPRAKYRNMQILDAGDGRTVVQGVTQSAGPMM